MINEIDFWTGLSYTLVASFIIALVNYIAICISNYLTGNRYNFIWSNKGKSFEKVTKKFSFDELKNRLRIIIIDDEDIFPISLFRNNGYNVEKWDSVSDYPKLESGFYDIIVLDIQGVAQHLSSEDGFGVLASLKENNPAQIIIAYSAHSYDLTKQKFWELADETISKPSQFLKMKEVIDNVIMTKFNPKRYISVLHNTLENHNITIKEIKKYENEFLTSIKKKRNIDWLKLLSFTNNEKLKQKIKTISKTITKNFTDYE